MELVGSANLLRVATCSRELDAGYAAMHPDVAPGQYVMVSVSDNGSGMSNVTFPALGSAWTPGAPFVNSAPASPYS